MKQSDPLSLQPRASSQQQPELDAIATLAPQQAVQNYLNTLLQDATTQARQQDAQVEVAGVASMVEPAMPEAAVATIVATPVEPIVAPVVEPTVEQVADVSTEPLAQAETELLADPWKDGRPAWAQQRFECLLFKVAGLTLAVPLVELGGVLVVEQELRPLFGQPDWFLGLLPSKTAGTVKAIDTARWVMPEKCPEEGHADFKYVILMENSDWGMACHSVEDAVTLEPDQVSWRSERGRRPWLAGTVVDHMCAIMDVSALLALLQSSQAGGVELEQ